jgi:hypothetical protein
MSESGEYLLTNTGFSHDERPVLILQKDDAFETFYPLGETFTLHFDMSQRHCIGWRDITAGKRWPCPDHNTLDARYEQCSACQQRTGFNPAFYHATEVSEQQAARNNEPHILYLAYFGEGIIKVGISHAKRGNSRLLEQGARSAMILDEFPTALVARQYEEKIAALSGIAETIQLNKKITALSGTYDEATATHALLTSKARIESSLHTTFTNDQVLSFNSRYLLDPSLALTDTHDFTGVHSVAGQVRGMIGSVLISRHQDEYLLFALKKHIGYKFHLLTGEETLPLPARQISLF